jgi:DNA-directed RNA polymerase subunit RPC12/RpoP
MMNQPVAQAFSCNNCGAKVEFDPAAQALKCGHCGSTRAAHDVPAMAAPHGAPGVAFQPAPGAVREISLEEGMRMAQRGLGTPVTEVECRECGAKVNVTPGEQTAKCAFCGSGQVLAQASSGSAIRPESLIPFSMDKAGANEKFGAWLGKLWFRPSDLKKMAEVQELGGVYVPFWTFDAMVHSSWTAEAGYHYYETETYTDSNGNRQTRQVQRTRWQHADGRRSDFFDDNLVCASKGLPEALVRQFSTFDTKQLVPYQPQYLAGWRAEVYAIELMAGWPMAQRSMADTQRTRCSTDVPGDTQRNLHVNNTFTGVTFKHVLLPIWIAAYRYNGKPYQFLVNGQTGEVVGKAPWSIWKLAILVLTILAVIGAIVLLVNEYGDTTPQRTTAPRRANAIDATPQLPPVPQALPAPKPAR